MIGLHHPILSFPKLLSARTWELSSRRKHPNISTLLCDSRFMETEWMGLNAWKTILKRKRWRDSCGLRFRKCRLQTASRKKRSSLRIPSRLPDPRDFGHCRWKRFYVYKARIPPHSGRKGSISIDAGSFYGWPLIGLHHPIFRAPNGCLLQTWELSSRRKHPNISTLLYDSSFMEIEWTGRVHLLRFASGLMHGKRF
ncbi:hypothetical protein CDAR_190461 [Caerostris darwini]|uniref:Uncharacterized protein n=1 Tax=Caerostris darwini TaxID=1538125 RepID=A0AAV4MLU9_9ARAC|nr:hypothetical protein CDAR_190461 [Caerostris darwini]